jgi:hypothetical protein
MDVSLAQNVCYRLHGAATTIVKLDEDMFLLPDTIETLLTEYRTIVTQGAVHPGSAAPMIPLDGFCYRHLLEILGLLPEYESRFGRAAWRRPASRCRRMQPLRPGYGRERPLLLPCRLD